MKIMVFDVPAESGGALSVLNDFYDEFKLDEKNEYILVLGLPKLNETNNIKVLRFPWTKISRVHRLYFDHLIAPRLINMHGVDKVVSLQNTIIPHTKISQSVFVHNALPFSEYRFRFREDSFLWLYQNIIGKIIVESIKKADHVIVQANWLKTQIVEQLEVNPEKIEVRSPRISLKVTERFSETKENLSTFFYPAGSAIYKNHKVIIDACLRLKEEGIEDYRVIFTLNSGDNRHISELCNIVTQNRLPIEFAGRMQRGEVFKLYSKSVLLFPSHTETVGLPLIEAAGHHTPILVADCAYAKEVLQGIANVEYYKPSDSIKLASLMRAKILKCI